MDITFLCDHPQWTPQLARWHFEAFGGQNPEWTRYALEAELHGHRLRLAIPTTVIALQGEELLGSASLIPEDLPEIQDLSPWLASVFVHPQWRGRGIGAALVEKICQIATQLGVPRLHLVTTDKEGWYLSLGWTSQEQRIVGGETFTVMYKDLPPL